MLRRSLPTALALTALLAACRGPAVPNPMANAAALIRASTGQPRSEPRVDAAGSRTTIQMRYVARIDATARAASSRAVGGAVLDQEAGGVEIRSRQARGH